MNKDQRKQIALDLRRQGYNCAQSVIMAFDDVTGLDRDLAARLTSGLGTGVGGCGEICGVINAMAITQGTRQSAEAAGKAASAREARDLLERFSAHTGGRVRCADLKGKEGVMPCTDLVLLGVDILYDYFVEKGQISKS